MTIVDASFVDFKQYKQFTYLLPDSVSQLIQVYLSRTVTANQRPACFRDGAI